VIWRARLWNSDAKRNFEAESFGKASFGASHGNDILPWLIRDLGNQIDIPNWRSLAKAANPLMADYGSWGCSLVPEEGVEPSG